MDRRWVTGRWPCGPVAELHVAEIVIGGLFLEDPGLGAAETVLMLGRTTNQSGCDWSCLGSFVWAALAGSAGLHVAVTRMLHLS